MDMHFFMLLKNLYDKEVVLAAVQQNSHALKYVAEELQLDKEIVLVAEQNNWGVKIL